MWRRLARSCQAAPFHHRTPKLTICGKFGDGPGFEPQSSPIRSSFLSRSRQSRKPTHPRPEQGGVRATVSQPGPPSCHACALPCLPTSGEHTKKTMAPWARTTAQYVSVSPAFSSAGRSGCPHPAPATSPDALLFMCPLDRDRRSPDYRARNSNQDLKLLKLP